MTISASTQIYGVVGDPVTHSLSPIMHNAWFEDHGVDAVYVALALKTGDAVAALRALRQFGISGLNITIPHKQAAAAAADRSEAATANVLRWEKDGTISAFNTDGLGFLDALGERAPDWRVRVKRVLVLGAGGAGLEIGQALAPYVETVHFANRTSARAEAAAASARNARVLRWDDLTRGFGAADLIVQATSLAMAGAADQAWPVEHCRRDALIADIVYRPLETPLLAAARARGLATMDGLGMLIHQGARAFELWLGVQPDVGKARARLLAALKA